MKHKLESYPSVPMEAVPTPSGKELLKHIDINHWTPTSIENRTIICSVSDFIMDFKFRNKGLLQYGMPSVLLNGHLTDIVLDPDTVSCMIGGTYLMSLRDLNKALNQSITILWTWKDDLDPKDIEKAAKCLKKRPYGDEEDEWFMEAIAWPGKCFKPIDPGVLTPEYLLSRFDRKHCDEHDRKCMMTYLAFQRHVLTGGIINYDGSGAFMVDMDKVEGAVYPDEAIATTDDLIIPLEMLYNVFGRRLDICWYNK